MPGEDETLSQQDTDQKPSLLEQSRKRIRRWIILLASLIAVGYLSLLVLLVIAEPRLVFPAAFQSHDAAATSSNNQQPTIEIGSCIPWRYDGPEGSSIEGILYEHPDAKRTVLYLHGNGVIAANLGGWIKRLGQHLHANVLAAEWRSFVDPDLIPTEQNVVADSIAAHDALCKRFQINPEDVVVYGRSLGGGCAAAVAAARNPKTLILESTFDSAADVGATKYPIFPIRLLMRNPFDSVSRLRSFNGQLIQIHGTHDRVVPIANARNLHQSIGSTKKTFIEIPTMGHLDRVPTEVLDQIDSLIQ